MKSKLTQEQLKQLVNNKYNLDLLLKHVKRLEEAIRKIRIQLNSGYPNEKKINTIDTIVKNAEKFI